VEVAIVVPCYNEAARLDRSAILAHAASEPSIRFVFVNDGSTDNTLAVLRDLAAAIGPSARVVDLATNRGKAEAVRAGMLEAFTLQCPYVGFWDADLATPLEAIGVFTALLNGRPDIDVVMGARVRLLGRSIERQALRHYVGRVFATVASLALALPVYDTQCGAKLFRATPAIQALFAQPFLSPWVFDVELLARLLASKGAEGSRSDVIYELPLLRWTDVPGSKVRPWDFVRAIWDVIRIRRRYPVTRRRRVR
jgi:dolichyl-phosphate beta-glucosyltransferase